MREILTFHVGGCGAYVGSKVWNVIFDEHGLAPSGRYNGDSDLQLERIDAYFSEDIRSGAFRSRALFLDTNRGCRDTILGGPASYGSTFDDAHFITSTGGSCGISTYPKTVYTEGAELMAMTMDAVRRTAEQCERMQGFQITHGLGGSTGSGITSLLTTHLRDEYPGRSIQTFTFFPASCSMSSPPSSEQSNPTATPTSVVEPYNTVLSMPSLIDGVDACVLLENSALRNILERMYKMSTVTHGDMNHFATSMISNSTASFRFPSLTNQTIRSLCTNLVPFPKLHFISVTHSPYNRFGCGFNMSHLPQLVSYLFDRRYLVNTQSSSPFEFRYLAAVVIARGRMSQADFHKYLNLAWEKDNMAVDWIPDNLKTAHCDVPPKGCRQSLTLLSNNTLVADTTLRATATAFDSMFTKKSHLHWYTSEGMEESEFVESRERLMDLISDYQQLSQDEEDQE
eukprot:PhF_6_TR1025/c0_g1_i4/m.2067/K07375/TUBB; tubulin beta